MGRATACKKVLLLCHNTRRCCRQRQRCLTLIRRSYALALALSRSLVFCTFAGKSNLHSNNNKQTNTHRSAAKLWKVREHQGERQETWEHQQQLWSEQSREEQEVSERTALVCVGLLCKRWTRCTAAYLVALILSQKEAYVVDLSI